MNNYLFRISQVCIFFLKKFQKRFDILVGSEIWQINSDTVVVWGLRFFMNLHSVFLFFFFENSTTKYDENVPLWFSILKSNNCAISFSKTSLDNEFALLKLKLVTFQDVRVYCKRKEFNIESHSWYGQIMISI